MRITDFPYVSTAMRHCSISIVITDHSKNPFPTLAYFSEYSSTFTNKVKFKAPKITKKKKH